MKSFFPAWSRCLLVLSICSMFVGVSWSADDKDKDDSDINKRIDEFRKGS